MSSSSTCRRRCRRSRAAKRATSPGATYRPLRSRNSSRPPFPCSRSSRGRLPTTRRCYGWTSRRSTSTAPASRSSGQLDESRGVLIFKSNTFAPVCESYFDDDDREVRFTVPYEAFTDFDLAESIEPEFETLLQQRAAEPFPAAGRPKRPPSLRQRAQVQEVPSGGRRSRARQAPGYGPDARDRRTALPVRRAGIRTGVGSVRRRLRRPR